MAELTVCICAYNAEKYIKMTLDSLEKQTMCDFEYLIVDDGSSDQTGIIVDTFEKSASRTVRIEHMGQNRGTAYCRNWALHHVKTRLIMFFDSDDIALEGLIEALYEKLLSTKKCIAVSCYSKYIDETGKILGGGQNLGATTEQEFFQRAKDGKLIFMMPITLFYREKAIEVGGYRLEGFPPGAIRYQDFSEDLDLWSRMSDLYSDGYIMLTIPRALYYYRKIENSLSTGKERQRIMNYKMAYIKHNLKLRREGKSDISYVEYINNLSKKEQNAIEREFNAGYHYRQGGFDLAQKHYTKAMREMIVSFVIEPKVIYQKLRANLIHK